MNEIEIDYETIQFKEKAEKPLSITFFLIYVKSVLDNYT